MLFAVENLLDGGLRISRLMIHYHLRSVETGSAAVKIMRRALAVHLGVAVLDLGAAFLGLLGDVAGGREVGFGTRVGLGEAERAFMGVLVAFDAVEADLVAAGGAHEVVGVALAGVAASAFFHLL